MDPTLEGIAALVAVVGAIITAFYGVYRQAGKAVASPEHPHSSTGHSMADLREIERHVSNAVSLLQEIRRALEGTTHRQERMVDELETMSRTLARMENGQGAIAQAISSMKHFEEAQVSIAAQIREEIKGLREGRYPPHRTG